MLTIWKGLFFPVTTLAHSTTRPPLGWVAVLLILMSAVWGWGLYFEDQERGQRRSRRFFAQGTRASVMLKTAVLMSAGWVCLTFLTLLMARWLHSEASFDLLFCVLVLGGLPKFLAWTTAPLRNRSWYAYCLWRIFAILMLIWMSGSVWLGLYRLCHLPWWQSILVALPFLVTLWGIGISEAREMPSTFRSAYRWQLTEGEKVVLYSPGGKAVSELEELVKGCESTLERVIHLLELSPLTFKPEIFLFPDRATHQKILGLERMTGMAYAHRNCVSLVYEQWEGARSIMAHELTHVVCEQSIVRQLLPLLNEGLASYVQHLVTPKRLVPAITLPTSLYVLAQPHVFYDWHYTEETEYPPSNKYAHAHALVEYLVHEHGLARFKQLCLEVGRNPATDAGERLAKATRTVYGISLRDLEQRWREGWDVVARQVATTPLRTQSSRPFTQKAQEALSRAQEEAEALGYSLIASEHLLLGLLRDGESAACQLLQRARLDLPSLYRTLKRDAPRGLALGSEKTLTSLTSEEIQLRQFAFEEARQRDADHIGTEHLLLGLFRTNTTLACVVLKDHGVDAAVICQLLDGV
jgi:hypothetical protein